MVDRKSTIPEQRRSDGSIWDQVGDRSMFGLTRKIGSAVLAATLVAGFASPADAGVGDLLVAPTRIVLDGRKGTEIVLDNIGDEPATYRISVEFRRMTSDGNLEDVTAPTPQEQ